MRFRTFALALCMTVVAVGHPLGSADADDGEDWKKSRIAKRALKKRPRKHPKGEPRVDFWSDSTPSNEAKPLKVKLKAKKENKTCNAVGRVSVRL